MVTIEDIARRAGVSYSTVSRALAGSTLVNQKTKERIERIAAEVGYQVNHVARSLAMRTTSTLGLIVPEVVNPFYPKLIHFFVEKAHAAGYSMLLNISSMNQQHEANCLQSMYERRTDGIVLVTGTQGLVAREHAARIKQLGIPLLLMGWVEDAADFDMMIGDDAAGAYALTRHLLALGHRRLVLVGPKETRGPFDRIRGFQRALCEAGLPLSDTLCLGVNTEQEVHAAIDALLQRPIPPTAVFAYQDTLAAWTINHLLDRGISIPQQIAVVGFDNLDLASYISPRLTTVNFPIEDAVEKSIGLLLHRIRAGAATDHPQHVTIVPEIVIRRSCGAL